MHLEKSRNQDSIRPRRQAIATGKREYERFIFGSGKSWRIVLCIRTSCNRSYTCL